MKKTRRGYGLAVTLAVVCAISTACSEGGGRPDPAVTVTEVETPVYVPEPNDPTSPWEDDKVPADPFTALVVQLSWQEQSDADKRDFCEGLELFGPEIVADFFRESATGQDNSDVDEDLAVEMLEDRCRKEGYLTS